MKDQQLGVDRVECQGDGSIFRTNPKEKTHDKHAILVSETELLGLAGESQLKHRGKSTFLH